MFEDKPESDGTITDIDGNVYHVVNIGNQVWMVENLKTTRYRNGDSIPNVTDHTIWIPLNSGAYGNYNNDSSNADSYGRLYNWYAVADYRCIAPEGWHIPTDAEWIVLTDYLSNNGHGYAGNWSDIAKSMAASTGWPISQYPGSVGNDQARNNHSGFTALPGGFRNLNGLFGYMDLHGAWWSASEHYTYCAWYRYIFFGYNRVYRYSNYKANGFSVRCVKDGCN